MDIHEKPLISSGSQEILEKWLGVTIEPGLYYDFGVRRENVVIVDEIPKVLAKEF